MLKEFRHNENTKKLIIFGLYVYSTEMGPANPIKIVLQEISRAHVEDVPPLVLRRGYSWRKLNCKL
jgi:hypothetical protein